MAIPKISVILPVYNGEDHVVDCIESIRNQTYSNFEFIIVDDASTDTTPQILQDFAEKDPRIKILTHENNQRQTAAANTACENAIGEFIARIDADDLALPNRLSEQLKFIENNQDIGVVGCWTDIIDGEGNKIDSWQPICVTGFLEWNILFTNVFAHSSVMFRRDIAKQVGFYKSPEAEDYDLWSRMNKKSKIGCIPKTLQQRRVWEGQLNLLVPQETLDCVHKISATNITRYLNSEIMIQESKNIRFLTEGDINSIDRNSIKKIEKIILNVYSNFLKKVDLNSHEIHLISKDVSQKLYKLIKIQKNQNKKLAIYKFLMLHNINKSFVYYIILQKLLGNKKLQRLYKRTFRQVVNN